MEIKLYADLLSDIKKRIKTAQVKAAFTANAHLIALYWDIGQMIAERQKQQGWAASVIPKLSIDLKNELAEMSGFSERNLGYMIRFSREYQYLIDIEKADNSILPQPVAKLANSHLLLAIPWGHHALLIEKIKDKDIRFWYMSQTLEQRAFYPTILKAVYQVLKLLKENLRRKRIKKSNRCTEYI